MKKKVTALILLSAIHLFGGLPKGNVTLITSTEAGNRGIKFRQAFIEEKEGKTFITFPHLGTAELVQTRDKKEFYALFPRQKVMHEGKEHESLMVVIFRGYINDAGDVFCSLASMRPRGRTPDETDYILKPGTME